MKPDKEPQIFSPIIQEVYDSISPLDLATDLITDGIASRIALIMKEKGINKKELAALTHRRPSDVTRWLSGTHNFTCRTIALIEQALGVHIVEIVK